jgi:hypothetical protein
MPTTSRSQAMHIIHTEVDAPRSVSPAARMMFDAERTCRPPTRSICLPTRGPSNPEITSEAENAAKNQLLETARSCAIGSARIAGK